MKLVQIVSALLEQQKHCQFLLAILQWDAFHGDSKRWREITSKFFYHIDHKTIYQKQAAFYLHYISQNNRISISHIQQQKNKVCKNLLQTENPVTKENIKSHVVQNIKFLGFQGLNNLYKQRTLSKHLDDSLFAVSTLESILKCFSVNENQLLECVYKGILHIEYRYSTVIFDYNEVCDLLEFRCESQQFVKMVSPSAEILELVNSGKVTAAYRNKNIYMLKPDLNTYYPETINFTSNVLPNRDISISFIQSIKVAAVQKSLGLKIILSSQYYSFEKVLKELQMEEDELKRLVSEGEIRAFRDEDKMKFKKSDIDGLKKGRMTEPTIILPSGEPDDSSEDSEVLLVEEDTSETLLDIDDLDGGDSSSTTVPTVDFSSSDFDDSSYPSETITEELTFEEDSGSYVLESSDDVFIDSSGELLDVSSDSSGKTFIESDTELQTEPLDMDSDIIESADFETDFADSATGDETVPVDDDSYGLIDADQPGPFDTTGSSPFGTTGSSPFDPEQSDSVESSPFHSVGSSAFDPGQSDSPDSAESSPFDLAGSSPFDPGQSDPSFDPEQPNPFDILQPSSFDTASEEGEQTIDLFSQDSQSLDASPTGETSEWSWESDEGALDTDDISSFFSPPDVMSEIEPPKDVTFDQEKASFKSKSDKERSSNLTKSKSQKKQYLSQGKIRSIIGMLTFVPKAVVSIFTITLFSVVSTTISAMTLIFLTLQKITTSTVNIVKKFLLWLKSKSIKTVAGIEVPLFESLLSEDAGQPGILERTIAQSKIIISVLQITIGLQIIAFINLFDNLLEFVAGYINNIYRTWKISKSVKKRLSRRDSKKQIQGIYDELQIIRYQISRLLCLPRFCPYQGQQNLDEVMALELVLEIRYRLDEMKRDLSILTVKGMKNTAKKTVWDFIKSFIPNPTELVTPWKDFFIFIFFMKYSRRDLYVMYSEILMSYEYIIINLDQEEQLPMEEYEKNMIAQVDKVYKKQDIEVHIEECSLQIQRIIQMLTNAHKIIEVRHFDLESLWLECKSNNNGDYHLATRFTLEWEKRVNNYVETHIKRKTKWHKYEKMLFNRRYNLQKKLAAKFI
ncbi:hypothetical protein [Candidatus Uabimicrobium sp. HlEnr_7]|uniref:hypothetical protein n=1 Tax=Candidatus Uabimicrobium helgolandensis TaxID=3095367 RepID=UPI0035564D58